MREPFFARDFLPYAIVIVAFTLILYLILKPLFIIGLILLAFVLFFFRNPRRTVPDDVKAIVSPADGRVMSVDEIAEETFLGSKAVRVSIFLSLFNVHINRSPIEGVVKYTSYRPGKYLPAFKSHASDINERNTIGIEGSGTRVLVHQITGFVARRIVCGVKEGEYLRRGQIFGLIKFGSCTEVIVPAETAIKVKPGDRVKGAETIIGVIN